MVVAAAGEPGTTRSSITTAETAVSRKCQHFYVHCGSISLCAL